jgi:hypothetical protein
MGWEKLIISPKSSKIIKEYITNLNKVDGFDGKYIGIIPIYWDSLGIHNKNNYMKEGDLLDKKLNDLNISSSEIIHNVYTTKSHFLVSREFYYLQNMNDLMESYYPVFRFNNSLNFTMREIKNQTREWLKDQGFNIFSDFEFFRIYKMNGFHLFAVILPKKQDTTKLKENWQSNFSLELLPLKNQEIINPFMKISYSKYEFEKNGFIGKIWNQSIQGYYVNSINRNIDLSNKLNILHFKVKWSEFLATLANLIDSESNDNIHLYFKCNIYDQTQINNNLFDKLIKEKKEKQENENINRDPDEMEF